MGKTMNCRNTGTHTVKAGDSFYTIAQMHGMTMEEIMQMNPGLDPYNLQIGSLVVICNDTHTMPETPNTGVNPGNWAEMMWLYQTMQHVWLSHVYQIHMLLTSIAADLKDKDAVTKLLMQNPAQIAEIFARYYPREEADNLARLLTEHLQIGSAMMTAWKEGDMTRANELNRQWYGNASMIASALARMNPNYNQEELYRMLANHLRLTAQEIGFRLSGRYEEELEALQANIQQILSMADYLANGIVEQFLQGMNTQ